MPIKLLFLIVCLVLVALFTGFNLNNSCNVSFGFKEFENVPIFMTILFSFLAGIVFALPFTLIRKNKKVKPPKTEKLPKTQKTKRFFGRKSKTEKLDTNISNNQTEVPTDSSSL